ncbi:class III lanthionine synthetase LanKC N-terminal domain-containing protein [Streptococcus hongkongensis]|nr:hypothetical protein NC01_10000 [Streptococcus uberis]
MQPTSYKWFNSTHQTLPDFGYKIAISASRTNIKAIFAILIPYLVEKRLTFKYLPSMREIEEIVTRNKDHTLISSLITIYPKDQRHCQLLLEEIYQSIPKHWHGLCLKGYTSYKKSSVIHYHYGTCE